MPKTNKQTAGRLRRWFSSSERPATIRRRVWLSRVRLPSSPATPFFHSAAARRRFLHKQHLPEPSPHPTSTSHASFLRFFSLFSLFFTLSSDLVLGETFVRNRQIFSITNLEKAGLNKKVGNNKLFHLRKPTIATVFFR